METGGFQFAPFEERPAARLLDTAAYFMLSNPNRKPYGYLAALMLLVSSICLWSTSPHAREMVTRAVTIRAAVTGAHTGLSRAHLSQDTAPRVVVAQQVVAPAGWIATAHGWQPDPATAATAQNGQTAETSVSGEPWEAEAWEVEEGQTFGDAAALNRWLIRDIAREPVWTRRSLVWVRNLHPLSISALMVLAAMMIAECSQMRRSELE